MSTPLVLLLALLWAAPSPSGGSNATPTPPPPPVLQGVVKGPDAKPIENALVIVRSLDGRTGESP